MKAKFTQKQVDEYAMHKNKEINKLKLKVLDLKKSNAELLKACEEAVKYLEERGIRQKGTIGRAHLLPLLDKAINKAKGE